MRRYRHLEGMLQTYSFCVFKGWDTKTADGVEEQEFGELTEPRSLLRILTEYGRNKPWQLESLATADSNQPNVRPDNSEDPNVADCVLHPPINHYNGLEDTREQRLNVFQLRYCLCPQFLAASGSLARSSSHVGCSCRYSSYPRKLPAHLRCGRRPR
jgi:hypothetical protein